MLQIVALSSRRDIRLDADHLTVKLLFIYSLSFIFIIKDFEVNILGLTWNFAAFENFAPGTILDLTPQELRFTKDFIWGQSKTFSPQFSLHFYIFYSLFLLFKLNKTLFICIGRYSNAMKDVFTRFPSSPCLYSSLITGKFPKGYPTTSQKHRC